MNFKIGIGYDIHRTCPDRTLILGGVDIPSDFGLAGHSDADVVLHALCDALLGAASLGDIGEHFPDTDPAFLNADSRRLLADVLAKVSEAGFQIGNVDIIIHMQHPKLGSRKAQIQAELAQLLHLPSGSVGIKAKTNERLDAVGRGEAIACWAAALLVIES